MQPLMLQPYCPPAAAAAGSTLTPREAQVLGHLSHGVTDKEIAHACGISPRTVQVHLRNIYQKLGVRTRTEAVLHVLRSGG